MKKTNKTLLTRVLQGRISRQQLLQRSEFFTAILIRDSFTSTVDFCSDATLALKGERLNQEQVNNLTNNILSIYDSEKVAIITIVKP